MAGEAERVVLEGVVLEGVLLGCWSMSGSGRGCPDVVSFSQFLAARIDQYRNDAKAKMKNIRPHICTCRRCEARFARRSY